MAVPTLLGDLHERPDGGFDGWCWSPERPTERLIVDLLVNDRVAISMVAAIFRRDLQVRGYGDGRHGFVLRLPANTAGLDCEALITARERRSGHVFGRVLREAPGLAAPSAPALAPIEQAMEGAWRGLDAARAANRRTRPSERLRVAFGVLADRLQARALDRADSVLPGPQLVLPDIAAPALTVAFRATDAAEALARIEALAPALALVRAELLVIDADVDAQTAWLPARVRHLRYLRDSRATGRATACNLAHMHARGTQLVWLGDAVTTPSAAALMALAGAVAHAAPAVWLGENARAAASPVDIELPARLGAILCLDRALGDMLGPLDPTMDDGGGLDCADLALKARLLGVAVHRIVEPPAPLAACRVDRASPAVRALFQSRWGTLGAAPNDA